MRSFGLIALLAMISIVVLTSCKKEQDGSTFEKAADYFPMEAGKTFFYRLDSVKPVNIDTKLDTFYYLAKDSVIETFQDNLGQTSFKVYRYTTDTLQQHPFQYKNTYYVTHTATGVEVVENNLRFIKLASPVTENTRWKGNSYIDTKTANSPYKYYDEWNYQYQHIGLPFTTRKGTFNETVTVFQHQSQVQQGDFDPAYFDQRIYAVEVYAKGVGLIYKRFLFWDWQLNNPGPHFEANSNGLYLNLVDNK